MLKINGVNVEDLNIEKPILNDLRNRAEWTSRSNKRFIQEVGDAYFYNEVIPSDFKTQGVPFNFVKRGCRPTFANCRFESTTPGTYFLIKFTNKNLLLCNKDLLYTDNITPSHPNVVRSIGTAEEDLQYVFLEMCGAGGGGSGGNALYTGAGGTSGGYLVVCLKVAHDKDSINSINSTKILLGKGGAGRDGRGQAGNGGDTGFWLNDNYAYCAAGGPGAKNESVYGAATFLGKITRNNDGTEKDNDNTVIPYMRQITRVKGQNGSKNTSLTLPTTSTVQYTPENITVTRGHNIHGELWYSFDWIGGPGGNSVLGNGGDGGWNQMDAVVSAGEILHKKQNDTWESITTYPAQGEDRTNNYKLGAGIGGGGGGGSFKVASHTHGGDGGNGYLAIYY